MTLIWGLLTAVLLGLLQACDSQPVANEIPVSEALGGIVDEGYQRATKVREFKFPQDHGAHPEFRNEWWYFTGNLTSSSGQRFGYQVTFFRIALTPENTARASAWAARQIWMTHVAITDVAAKQHFHDERWARAAAGLAGIDSALLHVWLEDWQLLSEPDAAFPWQINIANDELTLAFSLQPLKPVVLQGNAGLSEKSAAAGQASYYYSIPRLETRGVITVNGESHQVSGLSWLDREWSTSALGPQQEGWDWFSLQLNDQTDVMFYRMRLKNGEADSSSSGVMIDVDGNSTALSADQVQLTPLRYWESDDRRRYPVAWRMQIPQQRIDWEIEAVLDNQYMALSVRYWEGAVTVRERQSARMLGHGYLEMTGY